MLGLARRIPVVLAVAGAALAAPAGVAAAPGDLDPGFGSGGVFTGPQQTRLPGYGDVMVDLDSKRRPVVAWTFDDGTVADNADLKLVVARLTRTGQLDSSFNGTGYRVIDFTDAPGADVTAAGVAAGAGDSVVAAGSVGPPDASKVGLVRLTSGGAYDNSFSTDGRHVTEIASGFSPIAYDLILDGSSRPIVSGASITGCAPLPCEKAPFVARFSATTGAPDTAWGGGDGHWEPSAMDGEMYAVAPGPGGGVVAAGGVAIGGSTLTAVIARLSSTGVPDGTFAGDGVQTSTLGSDSGTGSAIPAFGVVADGSRVVVAGQAALTGGFARYAIARFTSTGDPDPTWGTSTPATGVVHLPFPDAVRGGDVAISGSKVVTVGHGFYDPGGGMSVRNAIVFARLTDGGGLDATFAADQPRPGLRQVRLGQSATGWRLALEADGSGFFSAMRWANPPGLDIKPVVLRFLGDGTLPGGAGGAGGPGGTAPALRQCADGRDNDGDRAVDGKDPGCRNAADNNEADESVRDLVLCGRREISLVRADAKGRRVVLSGLVSSRFAGKSVTIFANYGRKAGRSRFKMLATARSAPTGEFKARVEAPPRRLFSKARLRARVDRFNSVALKLPQSLASSSVRQVGANIVVRGKVKRSLLGPKRNPVVVRRLVCGRYQTVGKAKPKKSGRYLVRFPAPPLGAAALYRAESRVLAKPGRKRYVKQYARAVGIVLTGQTG